jgi:hypothetical protein
MLCSSVAVSVSEVAMVIVVVLLVLVLAASLIQLVLRTGLQLLQLLQ